MIYIILHPRWLWSFKKQIGLIQCSSIIACKKGFSCLNIPKSIIKNTLQRNAVDGIDCIPINVPKLEKHNFNVIISLWERKVYHHIFTGITHDDIEDFIEVMKWIFGNVIKLVLCFICPFFYGVTMAKTCRCKDLLLPFTN